VTGWLEDCKAGAEALTREHRQAVLDLLHEGLTIGETQERLGLSLEAVCGVINANIGMASFLNREAT
jgi:hypothetical protein